MKRYRLARMLKIVAMGIVAVAVFSFIVMTLWNVLMPALFAVHTISFLQALGLLLLSKILFGGFRPPMGGARWRGRMIERFERMTPEEREKFKKGLSGRCGRWGAEAGA